MPTPEIINQPGFERTMTDLLIARKFARDLTAQDEMDLSAYTSGCLFETAFKINFLLGVLPVGILTDAVETEIAKLKDIKTE